MAEPNPLILYSEHVRILGDAQKRYDDKCVYAARTGFWKGLAFSLWLALVAAFVCGWAGLATGLQYAS